MFSPALRHDPVRSGTVAGTTGWNHTDRFRGTQRYAGVLSSVRNRARGGGNLFLLCTGPRSQKKCASGSERK
ncbi:hypothetical protein LEP1GSC060_0163 [Leptospira weilii serovar Ranarum str. ICFT]|uniref:Uncharacterized protein n=1 Tax=Leptospira weilii serovar Ranarum str. ICFT TaxID=1218598 RepID=N1WKB3_9LEPT|nr:hypothetical protein LEP1GSC060_0163 [Leptospira weilii serovar Ranarum str. ICFT]